MVVLLYEDRNRGFDYFVEEDKEGIRLLKINRTIADSNQDLAFLYGRETLKDRVNRLNTLYVGFTRAKEELYVVGVRGKKGTYPIDLLPESEFSGSAKPARKRSADTATTESMTIRHHHRQIEFQKPSDDLINLEERRRGEFIHRVLFFIEYISDVFEEELEQIIRKVMDETGTVYPPGELKDSILGFLGHVDITEYFRPKPGREVRREQEFSDSSGNLYRMDRVILDKDKVTVIDFKTGSEMDAEEKYPAQMKNYMKILRGIYPGRTVEGIIAYVDLREIRRII